MGLDLLVALIGEIFEGLVELFDALGEFLDFELLDLELGVEAITGGLTDRLEGLISLRLGGGFGVDQGAVAACGVNIVETGLEFVDFEPCHGGVGFIEAEDIDDLWGESGEQFFC